MKIIYKGVEFETTFHTILSDDKYEQLKTQYYEKPSFEEVKKQFLKISNGGVKNNNITNYYFKDLMAKTKIIYNKWSIEEFFECKELVEFLYDKTSKNKKVYPDTMSDIKKIETGIRIGAKCTVGKPTNFPIKTVDEILKQYNINDNYYDFSCGWGARLTSALKNKINYFGTDPNYLLTEKLEQLAKDYEEVTKTNTIVDIRTQGSEKFVSEWENTMGLAFSSPPYYNLEDYKIGDQSYKEGTTYDGWKDDYLRPTFQNIFYYLIQEGYFLLNINNFKNYKLLEDSVEIAKEIGFELVGEHLLNNIKRCKSTNGFNNNNEKILVFCKNGYEGIKLDISMKEEETVKIVEEKKLIRFETDKMIDLATLKLKEPELFEELAKDYPVKKDITNIVYNIVKGA